MQLQDLSAKYEELINLENGRTKEDNAKISSSYMKGLFVMAYVLLKQPLKLAEELWTQLPHTTGPTCSKRILDSIFKEEHLNFNNLPLTIQCNYTRQLLTQEELDWEELTRDTLKYTIPRSNQLDRDQAELALQWLDAYPVDLTKPENLIIGISMLSSDVHSRAVREIVKGAY